MKHHLWPILYLMSILLGNLMVIYFGIVTVLGLTFPAGAVFIGLTFSFRDFVQRQYGDLAVWGWMILASFITLFLNWHLAVASVSAFIISEGADWAAFKYLKFNFKKRIYLSNLISVPLDSIVFVVLAFGWNTPAIVGQALIKYTSGLLVLPFIKVKD